MALVASIPPALSGFIGQGAKRLATSAMPSVKLHSRQLEASETGELSSHTPTNSLPQLLQTPSGLALLELQGTINLPIDQEEDGNEDEAKKTTAPSFETPIGKLMFPDYSANNPDDTKWMKRAYLYIGRYQRMTGEVKKLPRPIAVLQKRLSAAPGTEDLEVVEIVRYKVFFKSRPEPVNNV